MSISKEERDVAKRYASRFGLTDCSVKFIRGKKVVLVTDSDDIEYAISMKKASLRSVRPATREAINPKDVLIRNARAIHGNKYIYDKVPERRLINQELFEVICPTHGSWMTRVGNHINHRSGCPVCFKNKKKSKTLYMM